MPGDRPDFNLFPNFEELCGRLTARFARVDAEGASDEIIDLFLLAAGLHQVTDDYLHREAFFIRRAERLTGSQSKLARRAAVVAKAAVRSAAIVRQSLPRSRRVGIWSDELAGMLNLLADGVVAPQPGHVGEAREYWHRLEYEAGGLPARLRVAQMRLPNPGYFFDHSPEDLGALANQFAARWPERTRRLLVVGARTSGSYLAPLLAATLRALDYDDVRSWTLRPRQHWRRREVALVESVVADGGLILVTDDPPLSGEALARVARELRRRGATDDSIVLALALFGSIDTLPVPLRGYEAILLPWDGWAIHRRLEATSVEADLEDLLPGTALQASDRAIRIARVTAVERLGPRTDGTAPYRGHVSAAYRAIVVDEAGDEKELLVDAHGVGLGYFADHAVQIADALAEYVPQVYGARNGLLYERHLQESSRLDISSQGFEARVVNYILDRRKRLPLAIDPAPRLEGYAVWRVVADILGTALSGATKSLVYRLTHAASKRLLRVAQPSWVDGRVLRSAWSTSSDGDASRAVKSDWRGNTTCFDALFDLASATADADVEGFLLPEGTTEHVQRLREAYENCSGEEVDAERLFLYELTHNQHRLAEVTSQLASRSLEAAAVLAARSLASERALAAANQRYYETVYFADVLPPSAGPLCAFDLDGVLETRWHRFPAITPASALALRALNRHGYRPVLATGRSLREIQARCKAYRLAGGIAEYGAVIYDHVRGRSFSQITPAEESELDRLRETLEHMPGVYLDEQHRHSLRAMRWNERGQHRGLRQETIDQALTDAGVVTTLQVMRGRFQTDFVPNSVDKGRALVQLAAIVAENDADKPLAFAIGDDWPDVAMLRLAERPFAPANMGQGLQKELRASAGLSVTRDTRGAGTLQAVHAFLGHNPRRCTTCLPPQFDGNRRLVVTMLAGSDGPRRARLKQTAALTWQLLRSARPRTELSAVRGQ